MAEKLENINIHENYLRKERIDYIDIAKCIGIFLVVFGHVFYSQQFIRNYIYSFHMPLFFLLSGIFFNEKNIKKAFKSIKYVFVPYITFTLIDTLLSLCTMVINRNVDISSIISNFIKSAVGINNPIFNAPLWFLFSLTIIKLLFVFIHCLKSLVASKILVSLLLVCSILFIIMNGKININEVNLYLCSIPGFAFYSIGYFIKGYVKKIIDIVLNHKLYFVLFAIFGTIALLILASINGNVNMHGLLFSNPFLYLINSLIGIFIVLIISIIISNQKCITNTRFYSLLLYYGQNSLIIMLTHYYVTNNVFPLILSYLKISYLLNNPAMEFFLLLMTLLLMYPVIIVFNKYLFFMLGKKAVKKQPE